MSIEFYILDTESTGLSLELHEIVEISIIRCSNKMQINRTIKAERPRNASMDALKITGKTINDLYHGISRNEAIQDVENFFALDGKTPEHRAIVAHNAFNFDMKFIHRMWEKENKYFPANLWLDTIPMVREYAKKTGIIKPKVNLAASLDMLKIATNQRMHSAKGDSRATFYLWQKLLDEGIDYLPLLKRAPHAPEEENDLMSEMYDD